MIRRNISESTTVKSGTGVFRPKSKREYYIGLYYSLGSHSQEIFQ